MWSWPYYELLGLFRYPPRSGRALFAGTLPLRYCAAPVCLQGADLAFACVWSCCSPGCHLLENKVPGSGVNRVSGSGPVRKRFRLNRKTPAHLVGLLIHSRPRVWKRLRHVGFSGISMLDHTRRRRDHAYGRTVPAHDRIGVE